MKTIIFFLCLRYCLGYQLCGGNVAKKLCKGQKHIACCADKDQISCIKNPQKVPNDKGKAVYPMNSKFKNMIIRKHNKLRNRVACGLRNYTTLAGQKLPIPFSLNEIIWNEELAANARILMKNCIYGHSKCHSTQHFPCSGQNLGKATGMAPNRDVAMKIIQLWFDEYQLIADIKDLNKFTGKSYKNNGSVGHFTAMMVEDQTHVGCAMVKCISSNETTILFGCNYSQTNMVGSPTYTFAKNGKPGEKCEKKSEKHKCLCAPFNI